MDIIRIPIGYLLDWIYSFTSNYGVALILFTLVVKVLLLPLTLKQQKSMTKMQQIQPKIAELQQKYKNDQQLLSQETMKLYKQYGVSPAGGCLPLLIQLPILFALYQVIYKPLTYMCHYGPDKIKELVQVTKDAGVNIAARMEQIAAAQFNNEINFDFLGLNLADAPELSMAMWYTLLIPVLAAVTTFLSSKITQWMNKKTKDEKKEEKKPQRILSPEQKQPANSNSSEGMTKTMSWIMPIFTLWITYTLPMAMGLYWIVSNVFSILQTVLLNKHYSTKFEGELKEKEAARIARQTEIHGNSKKRRNK